MHARIDFLCQVKEKLGSNRVDPQGTEPNREPNRNRDMLLGPVLGSLAIRFSVLGSCGSGSVPCGSGTALTPNLM